MTDANPVVRRLLEANPLREPALNAVIEALHLSHGSSGLDVGCGVGLQALQLVEAIGPHGRVIGLDIDPDLLAVGDGLVARAGRSGQISFRRGDMNRLPFPDRAFDWAWSADCVGYPLGELAPMLAELARVVRPGGSVNILGWSSQQMLPGHQVLEAKLNATCSAYLPFLAGVDPSRHFLRAPRWFSDAGLEDVQAITIAGDVRAPLQSGMRTALGSLLEMLWSEPPSRSDESGASAAEQLASEAWRESRRWCTPGSPDFILDMPGYYAFFTYTVFRGRVPGG